MIGIKPTESAGMSPENDQLRERECKTGSLYVALDGQTCYVNQAALVNTKTV